MISAYAFVVKSSVGCAVGIVYLLEPVLVIGALTEKIHSCIGGAAGIETILVPHLDVQVVGDRPVALGPAALPLQHAGET